MGEPVVPGVTLLGLGASNAALVEADTGLVVVDTGTPGHAEAIVDAVRQAGRRPADLSDVLLTHNHLDHAGSVARLAAVTGAAVSIHALDAPELRAGLPTRPLHGRGPSSALMRFAPSRALEAADIAHELVDAETLERAAGIRVVHTPGHTAGHCSFLWPGSGGVLFVGDAASNILGRLGRPLVAEDWADVPPSVARIAALDFEVAVFGHGRLIRGRAVTAFRRLADRLAARA